MTSAGAINAQHLKNAIVIIGTIELRPNAPEKIK